MCAATNNFYVVLVENLVVPLIFQKMFANEFQKLSVDVFLYVYAVRLNQWQLRFFVCSCGYYVRCELLVSCVQYRLIFRRVRFD